jgi:effector-binding domain-containing protein
MTATPGPDPEVIELAPATTAVIAGVVAVEQLAGFFDRSFTKLVPVLAEQGVAITGPAFARYHGPPDVTVDLEVGFTTDADVEPVDEVRPGSLPGGRFVRAVHIGDYDELRTAWTRLATWIAAQGHTAGPDVWEVYVTAPSPGMDPADLRTELYCSLV